MAGTQGRPSFLQSVAPLTLRQVTPPLLRAYLPLMMLGLARVCTCASSLLMRTIVDSKLQPRQSYPLEAFNDNTGDKYVNVTRMRGCTHAYGSSQRH